MTKITDVDRFILEGFCEYRNCTENAEGFCHLWKYLHDDDFFIDIDGNCSESCLSFEYCKVCGAEKVFIRDVERHCCRRCDL